MEEVYGLGMAITGLSLIGQGIPWAVKDWRGDPPPPPEDFLEGLLLLVTSIWLIAVVAVIACVAWPVTWLGVALANLHLLRKRRADDAQETQSLIAEIEMERRLELLWEVEEAKMDLSSPRSYKWGPIDQVQG